MKKLSQWDEIISECEFILQFFVFSRHTSPIFPHVYYESVPKKPSENGAK